MLYIFPDLVTPSLLLVLFRQFLAIVSSSISSTGICLKKWRVKNGKTEGKFEAHIFIE